MVVGMLFSLAGVAAFCKINDAVDICYFMDAAFFFKPFQNAVDRYPVAQITDLLLDIGVRQRNIRTVDDI